jgi:hypothetical protein
MSNPSDDPAFDDIREPPQPEAGMRWGRRAVVLGDWPVWLGALC